MKSYVERALFVLGEPNDGKSTQLRSMLRDRRLGYGGKVISQGKIYERYSLSNERWLYLRLSSPHEAKETLAEFLKKCEQKMKTEGSARRWNFAGALQISGAHRLPQTGPEVIKAFMKYFNPERVRAIVLIPKQDKTFPKRRDYLKLINDLSRLPKVETISVDARRRTKNGLIYADFFDFT